MSSLTRTGRTGPRAAIEIRARPDRTTPYRRHRIRGAFSAFRTHQRCRDSDRRPKQCARRPEDTRSTRRCTSARLEGHVTSRQFGNDVPSHFRPSILVSVVRGGDNRRTWFAGRRLDCEPGAGENEQVPCFQIQPLVRRTKIAGTGWSGDHNGREHSSGEFHAISVNDYIESLVIPIGPGCGRRDANEGRGATEPPALEDELTFAIGEEVCLHPVDGRAVATPLWRCGPAEPTGVWWHRR